MPSVTPNADIAELVVLDVLDLGLDGSFSLNGTFRAECLAAYEANPACFDTVFQDCILARAVARGFAGCTDLDRLALAALEVGTASQASSF